MNHPEWISLDGSGMHLAVARQLRLRLYVAKGAAYCQKARTSVTRYEAFCARNVETIPSGPYPPTEEKVAWYLLDALDRTRDLKKRTGKPFKGSSGKSARKGLGCAREVLGAPFTEELLKCQLVRAAEQKPPDAAEAGTAEAHLGVEVQCAMESVAAGAFPDGSKPTAVEVEWAAGFAIMGVSSMRSEEGLRSSVKGFEPGAVVLHCTGAKARTKADIKPFDVAVPLEGFLPGTGEVLQRFCRQYSGRPFIFRSFKKPRLMGSIPDIVNRVVRPPFVVKFFPTHPHWSSDFFSLFFCFVSSLAGGGWA